MKHIAVIADPALAPKDTAGSTVAAQLGDKSNTPAPFSTFVHIFGAVPIPAKDATGKYIEEGAGNYPFKLAANAENAPRFTLARMSAKQGKEKSYDNESRKKLAKLTIEMGRPGSGLVYTGIEIVAVKPNGAKPAIEVLWPSKAANKYEKVIIAESDAAETEMEAFNAAILEYFRPWRMRQVAAQKANSATAAPAGSLAVGDDDAEALGI